MKYLLDMQAQNTEAVKNALKDMDEEDKKSVIEIAKTNSDKATRNGFLIREQQTNSGGQLLPLGDNGKEVQMQCRQLDSSIQKACTRARHKADESVAQWAGKQRHVEARKAISLPTPTMSYLKLSCNTGNVKTIAKPGTWSIQSKLPNTALNHGPRSGNATTTAEP